MAQKRKKKGKNKKRKHDNSMIVPMIVAAVVLVGLGVFLWMWNQDSGKAAISSDGNNVLTSFEIENDTWCERNPVFCDSEGLVDRVMCWMPSSALLPAAGSGSCWAITTMEISWFHLNQKFTFLPALHSICDTTPSNISSYLAGIQQNRKALDNVLALIMTRIENNSLHPFEVCEGIKEELLNGDPVLVVIALSYSKESSTEAAHGVVAYGYEETSDEVRFLIADSNTARPNSPSETLVFGKSNGEWVYEASYLPQWYNLSIGFVKVSSLGVPSLP